MYILATVLRRLPALGCMWCHRLPFQACLGALPMRAPCMFGMCVITLIQLAAGEFRSRRSGVGEKWSLFKAHYHTHHALFLGLVIPSTFYIP